MTSAAVSSPAPADPWLDAQGRFFNPEARLTLQPAGQGVWCVVVDNALAAPQRLRQWAVEQPYQPPAGYPYPGQVCAAPTGLDARIADFFSQHVRAHLGVRRVLSVSTRLSVIDTPAPALKPVQWLCHRDRLPDTSGQLLYVATVLYLFDDPGQGGTSFYRPLQSGPLTDRLVDDSQQLGAADFGARYGLHAGYMTGSNAYFERTAQIPAVWNRLILYDGSAFHSADVDASRLTSDPSKGRLTMNSFIICRKRAA